MRREIMKTSGNTILMTGGGSGIGRALARDFHALGNTVIVAGRTVKTLEETIDGATACTRARWMFRTRPISPASRRS
jgi:short-subunit dehydrogenase involved in D-alanine esterification of teichoic acids